MHLRLPPDYLFSVNPEILLTPWQKEIFSFFHAPHSENPVSHLTTVELSTIPWTFRSLYVAESITQETFPALEYNAMAPKHRWPYNAVSSTEFPSQVERQSFHGVCVRTHCSIFESSVKLQCWGGLYSQNRPEDLVKNLHFIVTNVECCTGLDRGKGARLKNTEK